MAALVTAKMIQVRQDMRWKAIGVMKTMTKLRIQLALVLIPLAGPRILSGTISTWYNQAIPCHPIAKKDRKAEESHSSSDPSSIDIVLPP